jgi:HAD superfamily phosphatase (TIGR01668 family)
MKRLLRLLAPRYRAATVTQLSPAVLRGWGIDALMLDLDNTLVFWRESTPPPAVRDWIAGLRAAGIPACVVSNRLSGRARAVSAGLGLPSAAGWFKPSTRKLREALRILGMPAERTAMVGDQLFMDVLAGNRLGAPTILVQPLGAREPLRTRLVRPIEGWVLALLVRWGLAPQVLQV